MSRPRVQASLRVLNLALNLINAPAGRTRAELMGKVAGYDHENPATARRAFERDIEQLRKAGLLVQVTDKFTDATYSICLSTFPSEKAALTTRELALLLRAVEAWRHPNSGVAALANKLKGYATKPLQPLGASPQFALETLRGIDTIRGAIQDQQPISFEYQSRRGTTARRVLPSQIVVRGRALYVWGLDLEANEPRLFRLSRFRGEPQLLPGGETPASIQGRAVGPFDPSHFLVAPLMWVDAEKAQLTAAHARPAGLTDADRASPPPLSNAQLMRGCEEDAQVWEERCLQEADGVVVIEPQWLARTVEEKLVAAAQWIGTHDG